MEIGNGFSSNQSLVFLRNVCAHEGQGFQHANASGIHAHIFDREIGTGHDRACHQPESSGANVSWHNNWLTFEPGWTRYGDATGFWDQPSGLHQRL